MRSSMTKLRSTKKFEIVLDSNKLKVVLYVLRCGVTSAG